MTVSGEGEDPQPDGEALLRAMKVSRYQEEGRK